MFYDLEILLETEPYRGYGVIASIIVIFLMLSWISIIDIKKQKITFWKMLLASSSTIIMPLIMSFFCGCHYLKWFLMGSLLLWVGFLYFNIKYNKDKFVGKADIDLISAVFAEGIMFSGWMLFVVDPQYVWIRITHFWYSGFLYLLIGSLIFLAFFLIVFAYYVITGKKNFKELLKGTKISVIPMLMPACIMIPYFVMVS